MGAIAATAVHIAVRFIETYEGEKMKERKIYSDDGNTVVAILGKKYRELVLGRSGVASAYVQYITGCDQLSIVWLDKDEKRVEIWVDITTVEAVEDPIEVPEERRRAGGPSECQPPSSE